MYYISKPTVRDTTALCYYTPQALSQDKKVRIHRNHYFTVIVPVVVVVVVVVVTVVALVVLSYCCCCSCK